MVKIPLVDFNVSTPSYVKQIVQKLSFRKYAKRSWKINYSVILVKRLDHHVE